MVDARAQLRRDGLLTQRLARRRGREIKASLKQDRQTRAADTAAAVEHNLESGDAKEAWRCLAGWYRAVEERAPKPCYATMAQQTKARVELYTAVQPPGLPIHIVVDPFEVPDGTPEDREMRWAVKGLKNGRARGYRE